MIDRRSLTLAGNPPAPIYRGRFAPSPTGALHFGSLVAAVGSYLEAKSRHGKWLVRIENLDQSRETPGASTEILSTLEAFGMEWDGEVIYQSRRNTAYQAALALLEKRNLIYPCVCSRKEIADSSIVGLDGPIYPGTCRGSFANEEHPGARRVRTDNKLVEFQDGLRGWVRQRLENDIGDFVLRRADGVFAYQLAVVVDDAEQGITHVVRGEDLLSSTSRQVYLQQLLGYATPAYLHLPVVVNANGEKLSKQTHATPVATADPISQLIMAIRFLGQVLPAELIESDLASFWKWVTENWRTEMISQLKSSG
ncbi:MAG: tRNA glutamyl-Q(34) synthetase GluQRS [Pseudomonadota bacterium]|nr:tRNA glutamyl-Q(34) synthetase GluQRS [Pseudomonadota bacterium]